MENFKGTKGRWIVKHSESKDAFNVINLSPGGKYKIARVPYLKGVSDVIDDIYKKESEANAKLIAAAPEMLEMLIKISKNIDENRGVNYMIELMGREYYDKIQNLIKKATE